MDGFYTSFKEIHLIWLNKSSSDIRHGHKFEQKVNTYKEEKNTDSVTKAQKRQRFYLIRHNYTDTRTETEKKTEMISNIRQKRHDTQEKRQTKKQEKLTKQVTMTKINTVTKKKIEITRNPMNKDTEGDIFIKNIHYG